MSETYHPDSPLIDGGFPRCNSERVSILLEYAEYLLTPEGDSWSHSSETRREIASKVATLRAEWLKQSSQEILTPPLVHPENEYEHWNEIEDELISLISDLLPEPWYMTLHPDDPGTVVIWNAEEDEDA